MKIITNGVRGERRLTRLKNLRRVMRFVAKKPKGAYRITYWGRIYESLEEMEEFENLLPEDTPPCTTVACTAGWAGLDPWFKKQGLEFDPVKKGIPHINGRDLFIERPYSSEEYSLQDFFGLSRNEANILFLYGPPERVETRVSADMIVKCVDKLLKKYGTAAGKRIDNEKSEE